MNVIAPYTFIIKQLLCLGLCNFEVVVSGGWRKYPFITLISSETGVDIGDKFVFSVVSHQMVIAGPDI